MPFQIYTSCGILVYSLVLSIATEFTSKSFIIRTIMLATKVIYSKSLTCRFQKFHQIQTSLTNS